MPQFGTQSKAMLKGVDKRLVDICNDAIKIIDFSVVDGLRTLEEQKINVARGKSWTMNSNHLPNDEGVATAVDLAPYPVHWADHEMFCVLAGVMMAVAYDHGVTLRWGGDWNRNYSTTDEKSRDYGHFEIVE